QQVFSAGSPMTSSISFRYTVYRLPGSTKDPLAVLRMELANKYPNLKLVADFPTEPQGPVISALIQKHVQTEYAPPDIESLKYSGRGLTPELGQAVQKAQEALILDFAHPKESALPALKAANELVEQVARKTGGLVWDAETRELFTPDAWHERRLASWT